MNLSGVKISKIQNDSFVLGSSGTITNAGFLDATLSFPDTINIYWTNLPNNDPDIFLASMSLPDVAVSGSIPKKGNIELSEVKVDIQNQEAMGNFSAYLINGDAFSWRLTGNARAKALGMTFSGLSIDKVITLPAFKGLKQIAIDSFDLPDSDLKNGIRVITKSTLENSCTTSIDLGDLEFKTIADGKQVGTLSGKNISLVPGSNHLHLEGFLNGIDTEDLSQLSKIFTSFVGGSGSRLDIIGSKVTPVMGSVSWLSAGFVGTTMSVDLNPPSKKRMQLVSGIKIPSISIIFNPNDKSGYSVLSTAPEINANFNSPFGFPLNIETTQQELDFIDPASGRAFMHLSVPFVPATADQKTGTFITSFANAPLRCIPGAEDLHSALFKSLTVGASHSLKIEGTVTTTARTAAGLVTISNVSVADSISFTGFQGFKQISIEKVSVTAGDNQATYIDIETTISNPSSLSLFLNSDVRMSLLFEGQLIGDVIMSNFSVIPGPNRIATKSLFRPQGATAVASGRKMLSKFMLGETNSISIVGSADSTPYQSLGSAFSGLTINTHFPGQFIKIVGHIFFSKKKRRGRLVCFFTMINLLSLVIFGGGNLS